jgi:radical SAM protein with 4Fe4S-binding SPASM domain
MITVSPDAFADAMRRRLQEERTLYSVQYAFTYRCNVACVHCYAGAADEGAPPGLTPEEVKGLFRQFADAGCLHCTVTGGEPLVRRDFETLWTAIAEQGIRRLLFTNATLVDRRKADLLRALPPDWIEVTILGADAATHDALSCVPGSFEAALAGIHTLEKAGLRVRVKTIAMQGNVHQIGEIKRLAESLGDGSFRFDGQLMGDFRGRLDIASLRVPPERLAEIELAHGSDTGESWCAAMERLAGFHRESLYTCGAARSSAYLSPWGDLHPCVSAQHIAYPLRRLSVAEAWAKMGADVRSRRLPADHPCRDCESFSFCQNCPAVARLDTGDERGVSAPRCALAKSRAKLYNFQLKQKTSEAQSGACPASVGKAAIKEQHR